MGLPSPAKSTLCRLWLAELGKAPISPPSLFPYCSPISLWSAYCAPGPGVDVSTSGWPLLLEKNWKLGGREMQH